MRTFRSIDRLRQDASVADFEGMLFQQAHWIASEKGRQAHRYHGESCAEGAINAAAVRRDGSVTRADEAMRLERLIERLPPIYRDVVQARLADLSFAEIGERLSISEECAQKRYVRGAARLGQLTAKRPI